MLKSLPLLTVAVDHWCPSTNSSKKMTLQVDCKNNFWNMLYRMTERAFTLFKKTVNFSKTVRNFSIMTTDPCSFTFLWKSLRVWQLPCLRTDGTNIPITCSLRLHVISSCLFKIKCLMCFFNLHSCMTRMTTV